MKIEIQFLFLNGSHTIYDEVENEEDISKLYKTFSENIIELTTAYGEYLFFRPSQVIAIHVKKISDNNNLEQILNTSETVNQDKETPIVEDVITDIE
jgi:hypothetical protein